jgi:hypothetical protein
VKRDVVLACNAIPPPETWNAITQGPKGSKATNGADFFEDPTGFKNPPLVVNVPYIPHEGEENVSPGFERQALKYKHKYGSIIKGALSELAQGVDVRTVSIITFSGGQAFAKAVMAAGEGKYVDSMILLDGLHLSAANIGPKTDGIPEEVNPWVEFAKQAWAGQKLLVLLHTSIQIPSTVALNTTQSAALVTKRLEAVESVGPVVGTFELHNITDAIAAASPPPLVEIWSPLPYPAGSKQKFPTFTYKLAQISGNYIDLDIGGTTPQAHIFAATYGQRLVWQTFYRARMNQDENLCYSTQGLGEASSGCRKNLTTLPPDMQAGPIIADPPEESGSVVRVLSFAAGATLAYFIGRRFWR